MKISCPSCRSETFKVHQRNGHRCNTIYRCLACHRCFSQRRYIVCMAILPSTSLAETFAEWPMIAKALAEPPRQRHRYAYS